MPQNCIACLGAFAFKKRPGKKKNMTNQIKDYKVSLCLEVQIFSGQKQNQTRKMQPDVETFLSNQILFLCETNKVFIRFFSRQSRSLVDFFSLEMFFCIFFILRNFFLPNSTFYNFKNGQKQFLIWEKVLKRQIFIYSISRVFFCLDFFNLEIWKYILHKTSFLLTFINLTSPYEL